LAREDNDNQLHEPQTITWMPHRERRLPTRQWARRLSALESLSRQRRLAQSGCRRRVLAKPQNRATVVLPGTAARLSGHHHQTSGDRQVRQGLIALSFSGCPDCAKHLMSSPTASPTPHHAKRTAIRGNQLVHSLIAQHSAG